MTVIEIRNCGRCHTCGRVLRHVLDGEEWCPTCQTYRRYKSHGWSRRGDYYCPPLTTTEELSAAVANSAAAWSGE